MCFSDNWCFPSFESYKYSNQLELRLWTKKPFFWGEKNEAVSIIKRTKSLCKSSYWIFQTDIKTESL